MLLDGEFLKAQQEVQDLNTGNDAMRARVEFVIRHNGREYQGSAIVKQIAGGQFESDPLEVGPIDYPKDAPQPQYQPFRDMVEKYYRRCFGSQGIGIRVGPGVSAHMVGNSAGISMKFRVLAAELGRGPW